MLLNVSNNKLQSLPESVGSCFSLEELQANGMFLIDTKGSCMHWHENGIECFCIFVCACVLFIFLVP